jgi:hypothetical protein
MKIYSTRPPGFIKQLTTIFAIVVITMVFAQGTAFATTAANTTISNTATVNYDDADGNAQAAINASVDVTVNLVEATPTLTSPADDSGFSGNAVDYSYTITANANGVDTYDLTDSQTGTTGNILTNTTVFRDSGDTTDITSIDLGATSVAAGVTVSAAGTTNVTVPSDGAADASLNGLVAGDTVVVNGATHTVASITDNASGTSTLELNGNGSDNTLTVGMQIGQQDTFLFRVTATTDSDGSTVTNQVSARDDAAAQAAATDSTTTTVNLAPNLSVTKYVRNVDCGTCNPTGGTGTTINGEEYWDTASGESVTGNPGNTMEYVIAVANGASAGTATNVVISDPVPQFTTYVGSSMSVDPDGVSGWTALNDGANDASDAGEYDASAGSNGTVYIYAGAGGDDGTVAATYNDGTGGSLPGGTTTYGLFQVTIDN